MQAAKKKRLTAAQAIAKAKEVCAENDWPFVEPVKAEWGFFHWTVRTNTRCIGRNARIAIHKKSGEVVVKGYLPR